jgi:glycosyltransferase involved in cell wall biosynthesis
VTPIKVVLIFRQKAPGRYSIEELFHAVLNELRHYVEAEAYEVGSPWHVLLDVWRLRKMRADIYHITGDINYLVLFLPWRKTVLTVHDIGHYLYGLKAIRKWIYKWLWLLLPMRIARAVTVVSTETRANIVRHLGLRGVRIEVVTNCYSTLFHFVPRPFDKEKPIILQIGTQSYKNIPRLIEALRGIPCRLVLIGPLDSALIELLQVCGIDYENYQNITHEEVFQKYVECDMVSFVSIGEGFGVPIIEANAVGRPLITSNVSPLSDIAGDAACLVDPLDVCQIREGILRLIEDKATRETLVANGLRNAERFSPAATARKYLTIYERLHA